MIIIDLPFAPQPQQKTRFGLRGGKVWAYKPGKDYLQKVRWQLLHYAPEEPWGGPIEIDMAFYVPIPKSTSGIRRRQMLAGVILPITRPDLDNYCYDIKNVMQGLIYLNDSQITDDHHRKRYSDNPRIVIKIRLIEQLAQGAPL